MQYIRSFSAVNSIHNNVLVFICHIFILNGSYDIALDIKSVPIIPFLVPVKLSFPQQNIVSYIIISNLVDMRAKFRCSQSVALGLLFFVAAWPDKL